MKPAVLVAVCAGFMSVCGVSAEPAEKPVAWIADAECFRHFPLKGGANLRSGGLDSEGFSRPVPWVRLIFSTPELLSVITLVREKDSDEALVEVHRSRPGGNGMAWSQAKHKIPGSYYRSVESVLWNFAAAAVRRTTSEPDDRKPLFQFTAIVPGDAVFRRGTICYSAWTSEPPPGNRNLIQLVEFLEQFPFAPRSVTLFGIDAAKFPELFPAQAPEEEK